LRFPWWEQRDCRKNGYFRAKLVQEILIKASHVPYTIVHSTQFLEFLKAIADAGTLGTVTRLSPAYVQPIAADDVADVMADVALAKPLNGMIEIAGPERVRMNEIVARYLKETNDPRTVEEVVHARYFGAELNDHSLVPGEGARIGKIRFKDWLRQSQLVA
jgi:uncharacterized protein YbjT (DUF2867 family)